MFMPYIIFEYHQSPQEHLQQENIMHTRIRQAAQCKFQVWVDLEEEKKKKDAQWLNYNTFIIYIAFIQD